MGAAHPHAATARLLLARADAGDSRLDDAAAALVAARDAFAAAAEGAGLPPNLAAAFQLLETELAGVAAEP